MCIPFHAMVSRLWFSFELSARSRSITAFAQVKKLTSDVRIMGLLLRTAYRIKFIKAETFPSKKNGTADNMLIDADTFCIFLFCLSCLQIRPGPEGGGSLGGFELSI